MRTPLFFACKRNGTIPSRHHHSIAVTALLLVVASSYAQSVPTISRWTGGTANTPTGGHSLGNALTLTWGFLRDGTATINSSNGNSSGIGSNLVAQFDATFGSGPGGNDLSQRPWFTYFNSSYNRWGEISGLSFVYENNDDGSAQTGSNGGVLGVRADMRVGGRNLDGSGGVLAYNYFPNGGDMVVDTGDMGNYSSAANNFRFLRDTLMHEIGHGIGCPHCESNNRQILMEPFINTNIDGPQLHDILMAHRGYGDFNEKSNGGLGNDVQINATSLGVLGASPISIGDDARDTTVGITETDFVSIDDNTDTDFYSFSVASAGTVDLTLEVLGDIYNVGPQGGSQISFNTLQRQDLTLALLDGAGSVLALSNATGLGGNEFISQFINAGTYAIRITGVDNGDATNFDTQFYGLSASFEAVPEPATMTILALGGLAILRKRRQK